MKKRHLATMTAMALAGALLAGCGNGTPATEAAKDAQASQAGTEKGPEDTAASGAQDGSGASGINKKLFFCPKSVGFDYWTSAEKGIMEAAKTLGYDAVFNGPATTDSAQQISMIQDMLAQGIGGLAIAPNDAEAISATIKEAQDKGVNTITFDTDAPNSTRSYLVCPDSDYSMGQELGKMIAEEMGQEGQLAFMVASFSAENQVSKVEGATDYLKENCPDIEIVTTVNSDDDNETAFANAQTLLTTYPDLKGILGFAGAEAPQAAEAITQAISNGEVKEGQIAVTGIGFPNQCRPYIKSGVLKEERKTESEDFTAYMLRELHADEPMNFGITICKAGNFDSISMERHFLTEEPQFCGDGGMVLTVADSDPETFPNAGDVKAFILKPGDLAVLAKGIWHDANHGIDKDTMYYFMATNKAPDSRETEWVQVSPEPVHVLVHQGGVI